MAKRLTDRQKKKIVADYAELGTVAGTARRNKRSRETVSRTLRDNPDVADIVTEKKAENTLDMLAFMDSRKGQAQSFIDMCLEALTRPEKIQAAQLQHITTAMGTVIDKFANIGENAAHNKQSDDLEEFTVEELEELRALAEKAKHQPD